MKLSEAIRLGSMLKPQGRGALDTGKATCALGAALEAYPVAARPHLVTGPLDIFGGTAFREQYAAGSVTWVVSTPCEWASVLWREQACPVCRQTDTGSRVIPHLNDTHKWTREQIADWVETIEARHAPQAAPVTADVVA